MQHAGRIRRSIALAACLGCAQVLGVPSDPELVASPAQAEPAPFPEPSGEPRWMLPDPASSSAGGPAPDDDRGARSDGVLAPDMVTSLDDPSESGTQAPTEPDAPIDRADAGAADAGNAPAACEGRFGRVPVDLVFIVDNSGSMPEEAATFEQTLPAFVALLEDDAVDYRIILLSRHRSDERSASEEASTSVCVQGPISGVAACPSDRPALGARFFHYSIKIDDDDSFERVLQAFDTPDPFGLTALGWSEWLRPGARTIFIEITDADSALVAEEFVTALQAAAPAFFGSDPARPGFVFHSVVGVIQRSFVPDIYFADEPIEPAVCEGVGSNPDNAGLVYQELSRLTGGLRLSLCPANALGLRLAVLASDAALRSVRECPDAD